MPLLLSVIQVTRLASIVLIHAVAEREMILPSTTAAETSFPTGETSAQYVRVKNNTIALVKYDYGCGKLEIIACNLLHHEREMISICFAALWQ
jgi:hypothetical protein